MQNPFPFLKSITRSEPAPDTCPLAALPVAAFTADAEGALLSGNDHFYALFDKAATDSVPLDNWDWRTELTAEDRDAFSAQCREAAQKGEPFSCRVRLRPRVEGEGGRWLQLKVGSAIHPKTQQVTCTALAEEITAQVAAEQQSARDRQMLTAILDSSPDLIFIKDAECRYLIGNRAHLQRMGKGSVDEIVGKTVFDFFSEERARQAFAAEKAMVETGQPVLNLREDDQGKSFLSNKVPFRNAEGKVLGFVGISRDITELRQAQSDLEQAKEEAEAGTRAKSEFLANMSHEIRTPMNAVIGMTGLLLETPLTHEQRDFVETIRNSGDALLSIINDILDFSKIESGHIELECRPVDLRNCIEESLDILSSQASKKGLDLVYLVQEPCPSALLGDVTRLRQILVNLLSNAVKFTSKGEVYVEVTADRLEGDKHSFHFTIKDTGIGIKPQDMRRLFRSFSQVDASTTREYGGTGLGLVISRRLCEMMGGELWCESEYGKGSTFHFTVVAEVARGQPRVFFRSAQPQLEGRNLLIVDDNPTNRQILVLQTKSWGMVPSAVGSGAEALELLESGEKFDVAILDWHMPEMDGLTLARKLQENPGTCTLPLVMLTSRATKGAADEGIQFEAHLTKPVKASHLFNVLIQHFSRDPAKSSGSGNVPGNQREKQPNLRILLAEDNPVNQKVALLTLKKLGHDVDVVSNGLEVLSLLEKKSFNIILMDVQMPELDGMEATRRIRQRYPAGDGPWIIAMTANAMVEDREACLSAGMDDYLSKPVKMEALEQAIARATGRPEHSE